MIIEHTKDTRERQCRICRKNIDKGSLIVKYNQIINDWGYTRMWFAHIECLENKIKEIKNKIKIDIKKAEHKLKMVKQEKYNVEVNEK